MKAKVALFALTLAHAAAAQSATTPAPATAAPATEPSETAAPAETGALAANTTTPSVATPPPATTEPPADMGGDAAAQLDDDQPGVADSLINGEALKIYGFGDVNYRHMLVPKTSPWLVYLNRHPSMFVGNLNFYFDSQLAEKWRALAEVRFTYLPNGSWRTGNDGVVRHLDVHGSDPTNVTRDRPVGGLMIQRAQIEYSALPFVTLTAGQWLTPYGIWNVDHSSPAIIGVAAPYMVGSHLLPESQVGLLASGRVSLVDDLEMSYALGASNGRTELIEFEDLDDEKAITARLALTYRASGDFTIGSTFFLGKSTDNTRAVYFDDGSPKSREDITYQLRERSWAFDVRWIKDDLHFQAEAIINERQYIDPNRKARDGGLEPDRRNIGGYALLGYRTPFFGLMPYVKAEDSPDPALQTVGVDTNVVLTTGGVNWRPVPRVVLKCEYTYGFFPGAKPNSFGSNPIHALESQIAWAF